MNETQSVTCACRCNAAMVDPASANAVIGAALQGPISRSVFHIPGMDCPSEEQMIRLSLAEAQVASMAFDLPGRILVIDHGGSSDDLLRHLEPLGYGARLKESRPLQVEDAALGVTDDTAESRVLWILLVINAAMFVIEMIAGWWANSAGLIADAADMHYRCCRLWGGALCSGTRCQTQADCRETGGASATLPRLGGFD